MGHIRDIWPGSPLRKIRWHVLPKTCCGRGGHCVYVGGCPKPGVSKCYEILDWYKKSSSCKISDPVEKKLERFISAASDVIFTKFIMYSKYVVLQINMSNRKITKATSPYESQLCSYNRFHDLTDSEIYILIFQVYIDRFHNPLLVLFILGFLNIFNRTKMLILFIWPLKAGNDAKNQFIKTCFASTHFLFI